jgi:hypothetical protein
MVRPRVGQVGPEALPTWLDERRAVGYTLVGLEQTQGSVLLPKYSFKRKTVLILGREREGIPPSLLQVGRRLLESGSLPVGSTLFLVAFQGGRGISCRLSACQSSLHHTLHTLSLFKEELVVKITPASVPHVAH